MCEERINNLYLDGIIKELTDTLPTSFGYYLDSSGKLKLKYLDKGRNNKAVEGSSLRYEVITKASSAVDCGELALCLVKWLSGGCTYKDQLGQS